MDTGLEGKHIVITGASGGIGFETTKIFLAEGAKVTGTFNSSKGSLDSLKRSWPEHLHVIKVNQTEENSVRNLFEEANRVFGRVDVLVANAGIANPEGIAIQDMSLEQWENTLSVNLTGTFLCAKYFFANLERHDGESAALIMIGSTAGLFGEAWYADYSTTKAGMHGLLMSLKNEIVHLAPRGRVDLVNPGWTLTPMAEDALKDKDMVTRILQTIPLRKTATPEDIASAILFLASDKLAGHVSGQTINVAGGMEGRVLFTPGEIEFSDT
ncbi:MAG: SDR family oxidoreductase [Candidatus Thorarchaeota archaeon]|nr:SDR family oxidoreductase [Candidatus Thorarchaeota archaeon]